MLTAPTPPAGVRDSCTFSGDVEGKYRWSVKHRPASSNAPTTVTLDEMFTWPDPAGVEDPKTRGRDDLSDLLDPREGEARMIEGDVWVTKIEDNDCDWHIELSAPDAGASADRVIAEVSQGAGFEGPRSDVARLVGVTDIGTQCFKFTTPARVRLTGWVFYDGHHWSKLHPHVGWKHGSNFVKTLWELHPVWKVEVLASGVTRGC